MELRIDYATLIFPDGSLSPDSVEQILTEGKESLRWVRCGASDRAPLTSPMGIRWLDNNGFKECPHKLEFSGVGCEHFELLLPAFRQISDCRVTRVDFAFDVVMSRSDWRDFITSAFYASMNQDRLRKRFRLAGEGEAMTIYIGSRHCPKFFRIYNKTLEDPLYLKNNKVQCNEDQCVIRYEIELKSWKSTGKDKIRVFDPGVMFDWYFDDGDGQDQLSEWIKKAWLSFGNEVLLPEGLADAQFSFRYDTKAKFCSNSGSDPVSYIVRNLYEYPHVFDRTLQYVANKFGKYLPYILADDSLRDFCFKQCAFKFGFVPDFYFEPSKPAGWDDLIDVDFEDADFFGGDFIASESFG